ncbi:MAG TPA: YncE family protein, partial [Pseudoneobacillus sp.]|nr:YncE family protein [Pseudoneobacillus sp.]
MKKSLISFLMAIMIGAVILTGCGQKEENAEPTQDTKVNTHHVASDHNSDTSTVLEESSNYIFTANEGGSISKIDLKSMEVINTLYVDGTVHNVQVSPAGSLLGATVVPASGHGGGHSDHSASTNGKAIFYDTNTDELIKEVEVGNHPAHIVFTEDGQYALVTNNKDNDVSVIDLKDYTIDQTIKTGKGPHGFRVSTDSKYAYIANMGEDTVSVINLENFKEEQTIKVGSTPVTTAITTDGKTLLATLHTDNAVAIVDVETGEITKVEVGNGPAQVYIQPDNLFAFIANQGSVDNPSNSVTKIDLLTKEVIATIETGKGAHGVVISPDNQYVFVTNMFDNTLSVIDNNQNNVIDTIAVDKTPNGISVTP